MRTFFLCLCACTVVLGMSLCVQAGAADGPLKRVSTVQSFSSRTYKVAFVPGKKAVVQVQGDGDTMLALVVLDHEGRRIAVSSKNEDKHTLRWMPATREPYQIKVYNRGGVPNRFRLRTN
jgi:hypothetical protein